MVKSASLTSSECPVNPIPWRFLDDSRVRHPCICCRGTTLAQRFENLCWLCDPVKQNYPIIGTLRRELHNGSAPVSFVCMKLSSESSGRDDMNVEADWCFTRFLFLRITGYGDNDNWEFCEMPRCWSVYLGKRWMMSVRQVILQVLIIFPRKHKNTIIVKSLI